MIYTTPQNPWGLTQCEVETIDALVQTGNSKRAASVRGCTQRTVNNHMIAVRDKMGESNVLLALLKWDRARRGA